MPNLYVSREAVKLEAGINGIDENRKIDRIIEAVSRRFDRETRRFFIPRTETRLYRWPARETGFAYVLWLDQDLISVTTLQSEAQNTSPTTIAATDYFTEPNNAGPPYNRIEIDQSSTAAFQAGDTPQRSISVLGSWGFSADTRSVGTVASGLDSSASATSMVVSDAAQIDVGDTLLVEAEQIYVSERSNAALTGSILIDGALTATKSQVSVTVDTSHGLNDGEIILVDSERMYVESSTATVLTVVRSYDGSVLAAHNDDTAVQVYRTLTIERGVNGSTAATHADATAISKYEPTFDVAQAVLAASVFDYQQGRGGWTNTTGQGAGAQPSTSRELAALWKATVDHYRLPRSATI